MPERLDEAPPRTASPHNDGAWVAGCRSGRGNRTTARVIIATRNVATSMNSTACRPEVTSTAPARAGASTSPTPSLSCTNPLARPRWGLGTSNAIEASHAGCWNALPMPITATARKTCQISRLSAA
jgi:hypothetical protein